ncbi:MAG: tryptophan--tRNA ligase, partial [Mariprofundales bacterium]|nr:tryptophan--tRNA ligase [Mariprofundales bacterium]
STEDERATICAGCTTASIGCIDCKQLLLNHLEEELTPIRQRREEIAARPDSVKDIIRAGNSYANMEADRTMERVRRAMKMGYRV